MNASSSSGLATKGGRPATSPAGVTPAGRRPRSESQKLIARTRRLFLLPLTLVLALLTVAPFLYSLGLSLTNKAPTERLKFVGLSNYIDLLTSKDFWAALKVTAIFTVVTVTVELVLAMVVALALTRITRGAPVLRALFLLPMAAAPVASLFNWRLMLNSSYGVVNYILGAVGLPQPDWFGRPGTALASLVIVDVWQWTPFVLVILVGGLAGIPHEVYEAAAVDGANAWHTFWRVTLPLLRPFVLVALLFRGVDALKTFDSIQILTAGGPGSSTTTLNYFAFREGISFLHFGRAAAAATLLLLAATLLARLLLRWLRPVEEGRS
ncbi:MAG: sugar transporter permease [Dactylosporangium sp.]|nr:sugar transporter permease [Dactylosporangium sp.]